MKQKLLKVVQVTASIFFYEIWKIKQLRPWFWPIVQISYKNAFQFGSSSFIFQITSKQKILEHLNHFRQLLFHSFYPPMHLNFLVLVMISVIQRCLFGGRIFFWFRSNLFCLPEKFMPACRHGISKIGKYVCLLFGYAYHGRNINELYCTIFFEVLT